MIRSAIAVLLFAAASACGASDPDGGSAAATVVSTASDPASEAPSVQASAPESTSPDPEVTDTTAEISSSPEPSDDGEPASEVCGLFSRAEMEALLGAALGDGSVAAMGTGCQWDGTADDNEIAPYVQFQLVEDPSFYVEQTLAEGFERLAGIGDAAFVVPEFDGWAAQAVDASAMYAVAVSGETATREATVELLRQLLNRSGG